jgi:hypothetical protein
MEGRQITKDINGRQVALGPGERQQLNEEK